MTKIINVLSPKNIKCIVCDAELNHDTKHCMCDKCLDKLPFVNKVCTRCGIEIYSKSNLCLECKSSQRHFKRALSCFNYAPPITDLIFRFKYGDEVYLGEYMAFFMTNKIIEAGIDFDIIIPVPLSEQRYKLRTFNQAEILAHHIADNLHKQLNTKCLLRIKDTQTQTHLSHSQRQENLKDAFRVEDKSIVKGKKILIVDDIFTTGATCDEIAKVLTKSGSNDVYAITFAHAVNKKEQGKVSKIDKK